MLILYLVQEAGEEGVSHVVVEERPLVHQDALDVLAEGRILTQQLHTRFSQNRLKEGRKKTHHRLSYTVSVNKADDNTNRKYESYCRFDHLSCDI